MASIFLQTMTRYSSRGCKGSLLCFIATALWACWVLGLGRASAQSLRFPFLQLEGEAFSSFAQNRYLSVPYEASTLRAQHVKQFSSYIPEGEEHAELILTTSVGKRTGFYTPYEGRDTYAARLEGVGNADLGSWGRLSGRILYARGGESNLGYSSIRNADFYLPYLVADSSGGDYHHEQYAAFGAYTLRRGNTELGATLAYAGEMAYRYTDPRAANTSGSLQPGIAFTLHSGLGRSSLALQYLYHRQYLNLWLWRPEQQDKFFLTYGFGMVDVKHTPIFFGTSRMNYLNGWKLDAIHETTLQGEGSEWLIAASYMGYFFRAEESSAVGLFGHLNHREQLRLHWHNRQWQLAFEGEATQRGGREYIYAEEHLEDMHASVYDRVVIDVSKEYGLKEWKATAMATYFLPILAKRGALDFTLGAQMYQRGERHRQLGFEVGHSLLRPYGAITYRPSLRYSLGLMYAYRLPLGVRYKVASEYKDQLDYQLAYLPLLDASRRAHELRLRGSALLPIGRHALRLSADAFYAQEQRAGQLQPFAQKPITQSHVFIQPETFPTQGHSFWTQLAIAYLF